MKNRKILYRSFNLVLGMMVAAWLIISPVANFYSDQEPQKTEQTSSDESQELIIENQALSPAAQVEVSPQMQVLMDIELSDEAEISYTERFSESLQSFFNTLFRRIISANAP